MNRPAVDEEIVWISIARGARILECSHDTLRRYAVEEGRVTYRQMRPGGWIKVSLADILEIRRGALK